MAPPITLADILARLPSLSIDELHQVRQTCAKLFSASGIKIIEHLPVPNDSDIEIMLQGLSEFMRSKSLEFQPAPMLKSVVQYKPFVGKIPSVMIFLKKATTNRVELKALIHIAFDLLHQDLVAMGLPVSSRTLMQHVHRIPPVINNAFPGYAQAGLLGMIVRKDVPK